METQENEKKSRRELEDTIEEQKEKISKYENRLRDMIRAYKGLTKEKEALEKSLKILQKSENSGESDQVQDQDQIQTLTTSLSTLSAEKSRLESMFQDDKRKLRHEVSEKEKICETSSTKLCFSDIEIRYKYYHV